MIAVTYLICIDEYYFSHRMFRRCLLLASLRASPEKSSNIELKKGFPIFLSFCCTMQWCNPHHNYAASESAMSQYWNYKIQQSNKLVLKKTFS